MGKEKGGFQMKVSLTECVLFFQISNIVLLLPDVCDFAADI